MLKFSFFFIALYKKVLSPFMGNQCRYHPTCSNYAAQAIEKHGAVKGWILAALRILNCHPWSSRSWTDPVPERFAWGDLIGYKKSSPENEQLLQEKKRLP